MPGRRVHEGGVILLVTWVLVGGMLVVWTGVQRSVRVYRRQVMVSYYHLQNEMLCRSVRPLAMRYYQDIPVVLDQGKSWFYQHLDQGFMVKVSGFEVFLFRYQDGRVVSVVDRGDLGRFCYSI